jgi:hypothetical protein
MSRNIYVETLSNTTGLSKFRCEVMKIIFNFTKSDLSGHALLQTLVSKISPGMRESWGVYVRKNGPASLHLLYEWLSKKEEALRLGGGTYSEHIPTPEPWTEKPKRKSVNALNAKQNPVKSTPPDSSERASAAHSNEPSVVCVYCEGPYRSSLVCLARGTVWEIAGKVRAE